MRNTIDDAAQLLSAAAEHARCVQAEDTARADVLAAEMTRLEAVVFGPSPDVVLYALYGRAIKGEADAVREFVRFSRKPDEKLLQLAAEISESMSMGPGRRPYLGTSYVVTDQAVDLDPDIEPWTRQPRETALAWRAFQVYRDKGPGRQKLAVYRELCSKPGAKSPGGFFSKWAKGNLWDARVAAWDAEIDAEKRARIRDEEGDRAVMHIRQARAMQELAIKAMAHKDPRELSMRDIRDYIETAQELERLASGLETDRTAVIGPPGSVTHVMNTLVVKMQQDPSIAREINSASDDELREIV